MKHKEAILRLRKAGKKYQEIKDILGCSKGTICYHCGNGQKEKTKKRQQKSHPYVKKVNHFCGRKRDSSYLIRTPLLTAVQLLSHKVRKFRKAGNKMFTAQDVIDKFGETPKCYLTGQPIDIYKPRTYEFDHIIPRSRGGADTLDNLGICTKQANRAKGVMTPDEFVNLCRLVIQKVDS